MFDRTYQTESDTHERVTFYCWWSDGNLLLLFSSMSKDKMDAEKLIALVHSRPELWNQNHQLYSSRDMKFKVWQQLGRQLGVTGTYLRLSLRLHINNFFAFQLSDFIRRDASLYSFGYTFFCIQLSKNEFIVKVLNSMLLSDRII